MKNIDEILKSHKVMIVRRSKDGFDGFVENCDYNNLRALCQKCHNNYDKEHRKETRRMTKIRSLKKGDTIKCHDKEEMINLMYELQKENIETDFIYEKDGVKGLWLIVTNVAVLANTTNTKI